MNGLGRKKDNKENKNQTVFTRETLGVILVLFATLCMVCLITRDAVFSVPGKWVNAFLFGCFGFFAYAVVLYLAIVGVRLIVGKKSALKQKRKVLLTLSFFIATLIVHVITMHGLELNFGEYLLESFNMAKDGFLTASGGGICMALIAYPVISLLTEVGTYVVAGISFAVSVYFLVMDYVKSGANANADSDAKFRSSFVKDENQNKAEKTVVPAPVEIEGERDYPVQDAVVNQSQPFKQKLFINNPNDFHLKNKRDMLKNEEQTNGIKLGFSQGGLGVVTTPVEPVGMNADYKSKLDYIKTPPNIDLTAMRTNSRSNQTAQNTGFYVPKQNSQTTVSKYINPRVVKEEVKDAIPFIEHTAEETPKIDDAISRAQAFSKYAEVEDVKGDNAVNSEDVIFRNVENGRISEIVEPVAQDKTQEIPLIEENFEPVEESAVEPEIQAEPELPPTTLRTGRSRDIIFTAAQEDEQIPAKKVFEEEVKPEEVKPTADFTSRARVDGNLGARRNLNLDETDSPKEEEKPKKPAPPINRQYFRPPLDLLESYAPPMDAKQENHQERMEIIKRTLEEFRIDAVPQSYVQGPSITRYEIMMPAGVSVKKVLTLDDDLKMRLSAKDGVRIEAPIPGKNLVGIEVANTIKTPVGLREVLEGAAGQKAKDGGLVFALGKDLVGNAKTDDLAKGPHYLVAGATGSGKSVCLNLMIVSLIMRYSPEDLRLLLVDPKGVEFINYEHIPHLMIDEIITEPKKALAVLSWAYTEMERRFALFRESGGGLVVDIDSYNSVVASKTVAKMPRIVIIIDELADLMETCKKELESRIRAIAQKARAAGIHLVLATQRPSVDIITGTIKANLPSRIAFKVMNFNDSQTILSEAGAEKLLGNGDMLYKTARMSAPERYQGAYISSREVNNVVSYIKEHNAAYFDDELSEYLEKETKPKQEETSAEGGESGDDANEINDFFLKALWLAVNTETVSISQLQRRFQIGFSRAGGLVDKMERMGFVSGNEGSKARRVLLTREQFEERFGSMPD